MIQSTNVNVMLDNLTSAGQYNASTINVIHIVLKLHHFSRRKIHALVVHY